MFGYAPPRRRLSRSFELRDQLVAYRNVNDLVGMFREAMDQARQQAPGFGDAQMICHGEAPFRTYDLANPRQGFSDGNIVLSESNSTIYFIMIQ